MQNDKTLDLTKDKTVMNGQTKCHAMVRQNAMLWLDKMTLSSATSTVPDFNVLSYIILVRKEVDFVLSCAPRGKIRQEHPGYYTVLLFCLLPV